MFYSTNRFVSPVSLRLFKFETSARKCTSIVPTVEQISLYPTIKTKPQKESFIKNAFVGNFDKDFLIYPEVLNKDEIDDVEARVSSLRKIIDSKGDKLHSDEKKTVFEDLVKSGVLKLQSPPDFGGVEIKSTHFIKICESLKLTPSEALFLDTQRSLIIDTLLKYGTDSQKEKYLRKLLTGEISGAYALVEDSCGSDPTTIMTSVNFDEDKQCYEINGQKQWITNGKNADIFIIFAQIEDSSLGDRDYKKLVAFIVEKESETFSFSETLVNGLGDCGICNIKLNSVIAKEENLLGTQESGYEIAAFGIQVHKHFMPSCILGSLKDIFQETVSVIKKRKLFSKDLKDTENVQSKIGKVGMTIYAMESMMYFLSGAIDQYEIDTSLESAIIQVFAYEKCLESYRLCMQLLGRIGYDNSYIYSQRLNDIHGLTLSTKTIDIIKLYTAITGIQHAGTTLSTEIKKMRNPFNFPGFAMKMIIRSNRQKKDKPKLDKQLYMNVHPSLKDAAEQLEYSLSRCQFAVESLLVRHGSTIVEHDLDLIRLANVAVNIFAMTSVLARASRSICTGIRHCDDEVFIARGFCQDSVISVKNQALEMVEGSIYSNDYAYLDIGSHVIQNGGYYIQNPTLRNIA